MGGLWQGFGGLSIVNNDVITIQERIGLLSLEEDGEVPVALRLTRAAGGDGVCRLLAVSVSGE